MRRVLSSLDSAQGAAQRQRISLSGYLCGADGPARRKERFRHSTANPDVQLPTAVPLRRFPSLPRRIQFSGTGLPFGASTGGVEVVVGVERIGFIPVTSRSIDHSSSTPLWNTSVYAIWSPESWSLST